MNPYILAAFAIWKTCEFGGKLIRREFSGAQNTKDQSVPKSSPDGAINNSAFSCEKCGHKNPGGSRFCSECGRPLASQQQSQEYTSSTID